jgi:beta-glucanase (GH16 family)
MYSSLPVLLSAAFTLTSLISTTSATAAESISGFHITWQENFSGASLDTTKWNRFTGIPSNGEQETYPANSDNCRFTGSSLLIVPENNGGKWTSCRIETIDAFTTTPGKQMIVQSRFKLGTSNSPLQGIWPAFWSIGEAVRHGTQWPACGEIDTFENINGQSLGYGTLHCGTACHDSTGLAQGIAFDYGNFHTWAHAIDLRSSDWKQQTITWYMDGQAYHVVHGSDLGDEATWANVGQKAMYAQLNVAVGGQWPGNVAATTVSGQAAGMEVLYVAVYESN